MKILILDHYYPAFLNSFFAKNPGLQNAPYYIQHRSLMDQFFGNSDAYSYNLAKLGHEAKEIVWNCEPLQASWAKEHLVPRKWRHIRGRITIKRRYGITVPWLSLDNRKWLEYILVEQIRKFKPDILYVQNIGSLSSDCLKAAREYSRLIVAQHATTLPSKEEMKHYGLVISSLPNLVATFKNWGTQSEYLPLAFDERVKDKMCIKQTDFQVVHVGGYGPIHNERNELLETVAEHIPVKFWGYGIEYLKSSSLIRRAYRGEAWGLDMYNVRASSRVTLTKHITSVAGPYANNCTLYEATGVGTCLVSDLKRNLSQLFMPGKEVVAYTNPQECVEKVRYLLENDSEREGIARNGQERTLMEHTYYHRMKELIGIFKQHF